MLTFSVVFMGSGNLFQILSATYEIFFCPWLVFWNGWLNLHKEVPVVVVFCASLNTSFTYKGLKLLKHLKVTELTHCSNQSFMGSKLISSNWGKPIWALLFKFRQTRINLFWSICNFDFNLLFRLTYQAEHARSK